MHKIIIDTDPGIDDALALLLALTSPGDMNVIGITTVGGNAGVDVTTDNALKILALTDATNTGNIPHIPVFRGCQRPLMANTFTKHSYYGKDGLGDIGLVQQNNQPNSSHAVDFLIDTVMTKLPNTITLCAIAPLTNVALACVKAPRFAERLAAIYIMGGDTVGRTPEFNFRCDPQAASIVLQSGATIKLFGFDVTSQVTIASQIHDELAECGNNSNALNAVRLMLAYCRKQDAALHDACVIASLIEASLFDFNEADVHVEWRDVKNSGSCIVQRIDAQSTLSVASEVDVPKLGNLIIDRIMCLANIKNA